MGHRGAMEGFADPGTGRDTCDDHGAAGQSAERAGGEPARRSTSIAWKLCVAVTLAVTLPRGAGGQRAAGMAFYDGGKSLEVYTISSGKLVPGQCGAQTPPHKFVLPVECVQTAYPLDTLSVNCNAVSFSVVTNRTRAKRPSSDHFTFPLGNPVDAAVNFGIKNERGGVVNCALPSTEKDDSVHQTAICQQNFVQQCGLSSLDSYMLVDRDPRNCPQPVCQDLDPLDSRSSNQADCICQGIPNTGILGTCTCLHWQRFSLKPLRFMKMLDSEICFSAPKAFQLDSSVIEEERCIYLDMMVRPYNLHVKRSVGGSVTGPPINEVTATVGQPLTLTVFAEDLNTHQTLQFYLQKSITSEKPSVELPRQVWLTEGARCANQPALTNASMRARCELGGNPPSAMWQRSVTYTPLLSESGMTYQIHFQAVDNGVASWMLAGLPPNNFIYRPNLGGTACSKMPNLCSPAPLELKSAEASITVQVRQVLPTFEAPTPAAGALPLAYPNCPMRALTVAVWKAGAQLVLNLKFGNTPEDDAAGHKYASPAAFAFASASACEPDATDQNRYFCPRYGATPDDGYHTYNMQWTPPMEAAGRNYKVCVVASDDAPSAATRCFTFEVKRCMYCTASESLSHVATRFRTSWLQIWSSNDPEWVTANKQSLAASNVQAWTATEHPHRVDRGGLIRLGPVYQTRDEHGLEELAQRFGTTVWALLELNPDLAHLAADRLPIPKGQEICVLPGICSAASGMVMDDGGVLGA